MLKVFRGAADSIETIDEIVPGSWVHCVQPSADDLARLQAYGIPGELLTHVNDLDERPRVEREGEKALIVLHFPFMQEPAADIPFITVPLTIVVATDLIITSVPKATGFLQRFSGGTVRGLSTNNPSRFVLHLLQYVAGEYLARVSEIDAAVDRLEDQLQRSLRNREVLELLKYEKSLVYFTTALRSNELVLERLRRGNILQWSPDDEELIDDVLIEIRQAIDKVDISSNILGQMMDAFASIVANNLNVVLKFLAAITIIVTPPVIISSFYGMNVALPGVTLPAAFASIVAVSILTSIAVAIIFRRKDWL